VTESAGSSQTDLHRPVHWADPCRLVH